MIINIDLNYGYGRLSVREPFLIAKNGTVLLKFNSDYALRDYIIAFASDTGEKYSERLQNTSQVVIPPQFVRAGTLSVELSLSVKEKVVKKWAVEPILFAEGTTNFRGHPEFEDIRARLAALEAVANNHTLALSELQEEFGEMNETVTGIDSIVNDPLE